MLTIGLRLIIAFAALYGSIVGLMYWRQRDLIYRTNTERSAPVAAGLHEVFEMVLPTPDGEHLIAWWAKAAPGRPTILYFHGNAGHLSERAGRFEFFQKSGIGLLMLAYRGFSGSSGNPSESANVADAVLAYDYLRKSGVASGDIVLFGESLGTGVAVQVATQREARVLVLDSPYTSLVDAAAYHYPWLPVRTLVSDRYDSKSRMAGLHLPLLVLHGEADVVVPLAMGHELFDAANEPKRMATFPGAQHILHAKFGSLEIVRDFIDAHPRSRGSSLPERELRP